MSELLKDITDDISGNFVCSTSCGSHVIDRDGIVNSVEQMRPGKNDGFDGLSSDYILNAPMSLFEILSVLFTCMLHHSYSPDSFCLSTMVPIPKGSNKDLSMSINYRGIALGSIFSKIFDNCIISAECLALNSDDLQFAYVAQQHNVFLYCARRLTITYTMKVMSICVQLMLPRLLIELIYYCCLEN